jgi:PAS domain S-box-containing protein
MSCLGNSPKSLSYCGYSTLHLTSISSTMSQLARSASHKKYNYEKLVLENVADIIVITDLDYYVQTWNPIAELYYGIPEADALGRPMNELVQFNYLTTTLQDAFIELQEKKIWQGDVSFTNKEGKTFYFSQTVKYAVDEKGEEVGILAVGRDISVQWKMEQKLEESEKFYRTLIADSLDTTLLLDVEGNITFTTPSVKRLLGYEIDEVIGTNAFQYVHPEDVQWAFESFQKEKEERPEIKFIVIRLRQKSGGWVWCMARGHNLLSTPYIHSIAIYIHDDTPRKQASDALKQSEKRFRDLIRDLQIGVLLLDGQGNITMTNNGMVRMFGITEEEILGGKIWELYTDVIHEDGNVFLRNERPTYKALQTRQPVRGVVMGVWHKGRKERVWIMISADPLLDSDGNLVNIVCSFTDITERKKLEKKILSEKMAYQRQLVQATIDGQEKERLEMGKELHDNIGQQLTTIKLFLDMVKTSANAESQPMVDMALKGVSEVINEVRSISRSLVPPTLKDLGFIDSVNDLIDSLCAAQLIDIELDYFSFDEDDLPDNKKLALFRIIQEQLNNIIKHAQAKNVRVGLSRTADHIILEIKDNGIGFDLSKARKGLGLANITNRADLFGGRTEITTSPGNGCIIKVWLPLVLNTVGF